MQGAIVRAQGSDSPLSAAIRGVVKGVASVVIYAMAIALAFIAAILAYACYAAVAAW